MEKQAFNAELSKWGLEGEPHKTKGNSSKVRLVLSLALLLGIDSKIWESYNSAT